MNVRLSLPLALLLHVLAATAGHTQTGRCTPVAVRPGAIGVAVGDTFGIELPSNPGTGHRWMLADSLAPDAVRVVGRTFRGSARPAPGSGGTERWTFRALRSGHSVIRLVYRRGAGGRAVRSISHSVVAGTPCRPAPPS